MHTIQRVFEEAVSRWVMIAALPWRSVVHPHAIFSFLYLSKGHAHALSLYFPLNFSSSSLSHMMWLK